MIDRAQSPEEAEAAPRPRRLRIWQLAGPRFLANLMFSSVVMVQTRFVGELGRVAVAAIGAGQGLFYALQCC